MRSSLPAAGGRMIGKSVSNAVLDGWTGAFYEWDGDVKVGSWCRAPKPGTCVGSGSGRLALPGRAALSCACGGGLPLPGMSAPTARRLSGFP